MSLVDALANSNLFQLKDKIGAVTLNPGSESAAQQEKTVASSLAEAFMLDLSPDAKEALRESTANINASAGFSENEAQFTLTRKQLATIDEILQKYKDAPFTQETYEHIQEDLEDANLSPESLMLQDKIKSFNPINILVNALSGDFTDVVGNNTDVLESKMDNYIAMVVDTWKEISTTADDAETPEIDEDGVNEGAETA